MDIQNIILNVKSSPKDDRDWIYDKLITNIESEIKNILDLRDDLHPVRNQGSQGTCYAQSAACMKEWQEKKDYGLNEYLSPQFFYNNRFNWYDENTENDEGMYGRDVMKLLKNIGICTEVEYPYGQREKKDNISKDCYIQASEHKIKGYAQVQTLNGLKQSLNENGPCLIAFPVYNYSMELWKQQEDESLIGGHAMTIVGYVEDSFIIRNSWGAQWGDDGYCYYKFKDWGAQWEVWTTVDAKTKFDPEGAKTDSEGVEPDSECAKTDSEGVEPDSEGAKTESEDAEPERKIKVWCSCCII